MKKAKRNRAVPKPRKVKNTKAGPRQTSAGANRAEGMRLFKLAGRPTEKQFILVYNRGPKMTWDQRAAAGVPAAKFQAALVEKLGQKSAPAGRSDVRDQVQSRLYRRDSGCSGGTQGIRR